MDSLQRALLPRFASISGCVLLGQRDPLLEHVLFVLGHWSCGQTDGTVLRAPQSVGCRTGVRLFQSRLSRRLHAGSPVNTRLAQRHFVAQDVGGFNKKHILVVLASLFSR
jgi:hypothetical protein